MITNRPSHRIGLLLLRAWCQNRKSKIQTKSEKGDQSREELRTREINCSRHHHTRRRQKNPGTVSTPHLLL